MALALDEPKNTDETFQVDGFTFLVDSAFLEQAKPIKIDYLVNGFKLDCAMDFSSACSSSSCGTSSCCC